MFTQTIFCRDGVILSKAKDLSNISCQVQARDPSFHSG